MPLLLNESDIRACLDMPLLIDAMSGALAEFSAGRVTQPVRTVLDVGAEKNYFGVMPASIDSRAAVGMKVVTVYHGNHAKGLTSHQATILLLDHATGALAALLDGRYITEARTAAVGLHTRTSVSAREASAATGLPVRACATAADAARGADLIVTTTASKTPILNDEDVADGAHICAVGACRPDQREMATALVVRARLFVDSRAAALKEAGEVLLPISEGAITTDHIVGELGDIINGKAAGRANERQVTIFKSLGMAVEDVIAAQLAVARAQTLGLGREISL